jgi:hypothetical protein
MADYFHGGINSMAESAPPEELIPRYRLPKAINFLKVPTAQVCPTCYNKYSIQYVLYSTVYLCGGEGDGSVGLCWRPFTSG